MSYVYVFILNPYYTALCFHFAVLMLRPAEPVSATNKS